MIDIHTNFRFQTYDIDAVSSYPSDSIAANLSKSTTKRELISISGVKASTFKANNINLVFGPINSGRYCVEMLNAPTYDELLEKIKEIV